ncbi:MAG: FAD synthase [Candidatus Lokiarchaeota archaeon]|nr:FAD synthase [Candidatus Lokiarchaeota archaeon]
MTKKVMIAGTFDILHPGHIFFINEAAKLGEVYVVVATDINRSKYSGYKPIVPENQRLELIKNIKNVKEARLGRNDTNTLKIVEEINPDIILLGPTQNYNEEELKHELQNRNLNHILVKRLSKVYDNYELNSSGKIKLKILNEFHKRDE